MLFLLDFDFLVLLEVAAGVFSDAAESITVAAVVPSAIFFPMLLLLLLLLVVVLVVVPIVASVGNEDALLAVSLVT